MFLSIGKSSRGEKLTKILVCTPTYDSKVTTEYMNSVTEYLLKSNISVYYTFYSNDSLVTRARNAMFTDFYNLMKTDEFTNLLWQDSDIYMSSEGLERIVNTGLDIIGPAVPLKNLAFSDWGIPCAVSGVYEDLGDYIYKANQLGTGIMMLSKKIVEMIVEYCEDNLQYYIDYKHNKKIYDVFRVGVDKDFVYQSEDWYLCDLLKNMGQDIYVDSGSLVMHKEYKRERMAINPQSIKRKYNTPLEPGECYNFWTPNDIYLKEIL